MGSGGTRVIEVLVGLGGVGVCSVVERPGGLLWVGVRCTTRGRRAGVVEACCALMVTGWSSWWGLAVVGAGCAVGVA